MGTGGALLRCAVLCALAGALASPALAVPDPKTPLRLDAIVPAVADRGELVTIHGGGFGAKNLEVTVGGDPVSLVTATGSRASFRVPALGAVGEVLVAARNPGGHIGRIALAVRFDGNTVAVADEAAAVTAPVDAEGGTIAVEGMELAIPPGAVPGGTEITATPLRSLNGSPFAAAPVGLKLEPSGLVLLQPATLTLPRPSGIGRIVGFGFNGDGESFRLVPHRAVGDRVELKVWHFSGAGVLTARLDELEAALSYEPAPAHELAEQRIAAALVDQQVNGTDPGPAIARALRDWRTSSVSQGLAIARSTTRLDFFELAFGEWLAWVAYLQEYRDTLSPADSSFFDTASALDRAVATDSAAAVTRRQLEGCLGPDLPRTALRNVIRVASAVNLAGLPIEETETSGGERPLPSGPNLPGACIDVEITAVEHAAAFARNRNNLLKVRAQVLFWSGDPSTTIPLRYRLAGIATETTSNGLYSVTRRPSELGTDELELTVDLDTSGTDTVLRTIFEQRSLSIPVRERLELHARRAGDAAFSDTIGTVAPGSAVTLRIRLAGDAIDNQTITLTHDGTGTLPTTTTSNTAGEALVTYTAPATAHIELVTATLTDNGLTAGDALVITTEEPVLVTVSPATTTLQPGQTRQFTATVTGTSNTAVAWSATGGTISSTGLYTAGSTAGDFSVIARTTATNPSVVGGAAVTIIPLATIAGHYRGTCTRLDVNPPFTAQMPANSFFTIGDAAVILNPPGPAGTFALLLHGTPECRTFSPFGGCGWLLPGLSSSGGPFSSSQSCLVFLFPLETFSIQGSVANGSLTFTMFIADGEGGQVALDRFELTKLP